MRLPRLYGAAALAVALTACAGNDAKSPIENVPDAAGLTMEVRGGAAEGLALTALDAGVARAALTTAPDPNDDLAAARARIAAVNRAVRELFAHVEEVAKENGAPGPGEVTMYGPVDKCVQSDACASGGTATLRLKVFHAVSTVWGFSLDAKVGVDWKPVAAGWMRRGAVARRGRGRIALNLDDLRAAAPAYRGQGYLLGGFENGPVAKALVYRLDHFSPDTSSSAPVTAAFRGFKTAAGVTRVRLAEIADLYGPTPSDTELGFAHVAWHPTFGGRAYMLVANYLDGATMHGDVPTAADGTQQYFFGRACYLPGQSTPAFKEWFLCPRAVAPAACVIANAGSGDVVVGPAGATWQGTCALATEPPELDAPASAPATTSDDTAAESSEAQTGLAPEAPPATTDDVAPPAA
jgi:hypothetical protein